MLRDNIGSVGYESWVATRHFLCENDTVCTTTLLSFHEYWDLNLTEQIKLDSMGSDP